MKKKLTKNQLLACIIGFVALNAILIIGIMVFAGNKVATSPKSEEEWLVNTPDASVETPVDENSDAIAETDVIIPEEEDSGLFKKEEPKLSEEENYQVIYKALIPGTYEAEEGIVFTFNTDGTFDGYYNADNPNVTRYNYDIEGEIGVDSCIKISNPTFTESESYPLEFTSDGKILMYYSEEKFIELGI